VFPDHRRIIAPTGAANNKFKLELIVTMPARAATLEAQRIAITTASDPAAAYV
jgi:hypothetical protein